MRKITILTLILTFFAPAFLAANEVNIFNARHYKADAELYGKFTKATGIKVNLINGKSGALEKRMIEEGTDSAAESAPSSIILFSKAPDLPLIKFTLIPVALVNLP